MPSTITSEKVSSAYAAQPQPINATTFRRYRTLLAIKLIKRFRKPNGPVLFLSDKICVKYGTRATLSEASTMQFVAKHTSIPIPRVYCAFVNQNLAYIVMERIHGKPVGAGWFKRPEESRTKILNQPKQMVEELRRITPLEGIGVARDFHRHLRRVLEAHPDPEPEISELDSFMCDGSV
ncbi:hypothetical protein BU23DRAFT_589439 [Bimuria novae-zelandiae CBS 107.79]|uniref:Aminoglycoside phosphotransferase domain-containing protein n=1 Tax=Bimuria novae-zelandiae CBS 107.79 TaxID=1447943 RepID=A0A6A5V9B9_9PLEO|nr:hypothetical protein BU23DRAFT_589439 [Bimuria novae-zelandiae CBS 107.79]